jgi:hypothetical protein
MIAQVAAIQNRQDRISQGHVMTLKLRSKERCENLQRIITRVCFNVQRKKQTGLLVPHRFYQEYWLVSHLA